MQITFSSDLFWKVIRKAILSVVLYVWEFLDISFRAGNFRQSWRYLIDIKDMRKYVMKECSGRYLKIIDGTKKGVGVVWWWVGWEGWNLAFFGVVGPDIRLSYPGGPGSWVFLGTEVMTILLLSVPRSGQSQASLPEAALGSSNLPEVIVGSVHEPTRSKHCQYNNKVTVNLTSIFFSLFYYLVWVLVYERWLG